MKTNKISLLLLLLLLVGNVFVFQSSSFVSPDDSHDETDDTDTEDSDEEDTDEEDHEDDHDDEDNDGVDDDTEREYEREVEVEQGDREWKIESELKNGERKDEFEVEFKIGGGDEPEIELEYSSEAGSTESEMKYRVNFDELIEFTDDGTPGYQEDTDSVVSIYELDKADWNAIAYSSEVVDGATVYTATAQTTDGVFTLILKISTGFTQLNSTVVSPNSIKIDVVINQYNYLGNDTYLALQTDIKTESETEVDEDSEDEQLGIAQNETQVTVNSDKANGFFSWVKTAEADGVTIDVISSTLTDPEEEDDDLEEGENQQIIFFTFDAKNPDKIVWDPKVGIENSFIFGLGVDSDGSPLPFPLWIFVITLAVPVWKRRRID